MFPSRELFDQVFMQVTDNYGVMVINNRLRSNDIRKKSFWYKAQKQDNLSICCQRFKRYHEINFDPNHDKRLPFIDMNSFGEKKNLIYKLLKMKMINLNQQMNLPMVMNFQTLIQKYHLLELVILVLL